MSEDKQETRKRSFIPFFRRETVEAEQEDQEEQQESGVENEVEQYEEKQVAEEKPVVENKEEATEQPIILQDNISNTDQSVSKVGVGELANDYLSDCESFLQNRNDLSRARNKMFLERFDALRSYQVKIEEELGKIKINPITLRAMTDLAAGSDLSSVCAEAARRRADTFSGDSTSITLCLKDFESQVGSWTRLAQLTLEVAMLAPLPELGRPMALQKNIRIFLKALLKNEELKIYQAEKDSTSLYDRVCRVNDELEATFEKAMQVIEKFFKADEQPMNYNVFAKSENSPRQRDTVTLQRDAVIPEKQVQKEAKKRPQGTNATAKPTCAKQDNNVNEHEESITDMIAGVAVAAV